MAKIVVVDLEACIGCGTCRSLCPKVFALRGDPTDPACLEFAMDSCPTEAIAWRED